VAALVRAIVSLRDDEGLRYRLACSGKEESRRFSIDRTVAEVVDLVAQTS
jgi:hypothetical protein